MRPTSPSFENLRTICIRITTLKWANSSPVGSLLQPPTLGLPGLMNSSLPPAACGDSRTKPAHRVTGGITNVLWESSLPNYKEPNPQKKAIGHFVYTLTEFLRIQNTSGTQMQTNAERASGNLRGHKCFLYQVWASQVQSVNACLYPAGRTKESEGEVFERNCWPPPWESGNCVWL